MCFIEKIKKLVIHPDGGYFVVDDFIGGFFKGLFQSNQNFSNTNASRLGNALDVGAAQAANSAKIWASFGRTDKSASKLENIGQIASRFTWELPNTLAGVFAGHTVGYFNGINSVDNFHGATVINTNASGIWGFTIGPVISLSKYGSVLTPPSGSSISAATT